MARRKPPGVAKRNSALPLGVLVAVTAVAVGSVLALRAWGSNEGKLSSSIDSSGASAGNPETLGRSLSTASEQPEEQEEVPQSGLEENDPMAQAATKEAKPEDKKPPGQFVVNFLNKSPLMVDVFWEPGNGQPGTAVLQAISAGSSAASNTWVGHQFSWREHVTKRVLGRVSIADEAQKQYVLTAQMAGVPDVPAKVACVNREITPRCKSMAADNLCAAAPGWMTVNCAKTCDFCHLLDPAVRCALDGFNMTLALEESDAALDAFFEDLIANNAHHAPTVHSKPPTGPWIVTLEDFVTEDEIVAIQKHTLPNVERSTDQGGQDEVGVVAKVVSTRRSTTAIGAVRGVEELVETGLTGADLDSTDLIRCGPD
jgi:hypothetical protein